MSCALEDFTARLGDERKALDAHAPGPGIGSGLERDDMPGASTVSPPGTMRGSSCGRDAHAVTSVMRVLQARAHDRIELAGNDPGSDRCESALERVGQRACAERSRPARRRWRPSSRSRRSSPPARGTRSTISEISVRIMRGPGGPPTSLGALAGREIAQQGEPLAGRDLHRRLDLPPRLELADAAAQRASAPPPGRCRRGGWLRGCA